LINFEEKNIFDRILIFVCYFCKTLIIYNEVVFILRMGKIFIHNKRHLRTREMSKIVLFSILIGGWVNGVECSNGSSLGRMRVNRDTIRITPGSVPELQENTVPTKRNRPPNIIVIKFYSLEEKYGTNVARMICKDFWALDDHSKISVEVFASFHASYGSEKAIGVANSFLRLAPNLRDEIKFEPYADAYAKLGSDNTRIIDVINSFLRVAPDLRDEIKFEPYANAYAKLGSDKTLRLVEDFYLLKGLKNRLNFRDLTNIHTKDYKTAQEIINIYISPKNDQYNFIKWSDFENFYYKYKEKAIKAWYIFLNINDPDGKITIDSVVMLYNEFGEKAINIANEFLKLDNGKKEIKFSDYAEFYMDIGEYVHNIAEKFLNSDYSEDKVKFYDYAHIHRIYGFKVDANLKKIVSEFLKIKNKPSNKVPLYKYSDIYKEKGLKIANEVANKFLQLKNNEKNKISFTDFADLCLNKLRKIEGIANKFSSKKFLYLFSNKSSEIELILAKIACIANKFLQLKNNEKNKISFTEFADLCLNKSIGVKVAREIKSILAKIEVIANEFLQLKNNEENKLSFTDFANLCLNKSIGVKVASEIESILTKIAGIANEFLQLKNNEENKLSFTDFANLCLNKSIGVKVASEIERILTKIAGIANKFLQLKNNEENKLSFTDFADLCLNKSIGVKVAREIELILAKIACIANKFLRLKNNEKNKISFTDFFNLYDTYGEKAWSIAEGYLSFDGEVSLKNFAEDFAIYEDNSQRSSRKRYAGDMGPELVTERAPKKGKKNNRKCANTKRSIRKWFL